MRTRLVVSLVAALAVTGLLATSAPALTGSGNTDTESASVFATRSDADWSEAYFFAGDGVTQLHADILRPKGLDLTSANPTPVVLTVSPYTSHLGQTTDVDPTGSGPSVRFNDFLDQSHLLSNGYSYVYVDLPGFGGSGGCNDWGGNREQEAVRAAVEWAASQPWSTGRVALFGKSYDGWTGLMGMARQPRGLAAIISLEPVFAGYRYIYRNGIHRSGTLATIPEFQAFDAKPGRPNDQPLYLANSAPQAWCYGVNVAGSNADLDENGPYWLERNLLLTTAGKTTPLFLSQGFLETNTPSDGAFQYFNGLAGNHNRAWFGQWDHCRAWETRNACGSSYGGAASDGMALGRTQFIAEAMRFLDEHLKGIAPAVEDPSIEVQDIQGRWRAEDAWPPADMVMYDSQLNAGTYTDDGRGGSLRPSADAGIWTVSQVLDHDVWLAGEPSVTVRTGAVPVPVPVGPVPDAPVPNAAVPNANVAVAVYDIDEDGSAWLISGGVSLMRGVGARSTSFTLRGQDWPIAAGHRIGVLITDADDDEYTHVPTNTDVAITSADISLPFLTYNRTDFLDDGVGTPRLEQYLGQTGAPINDATLEAAASEFNLPGALQ